MDDDRAMSKLGNKLTEFKADLASKAAAFEEFRKQLQRLKGVPGTSKQNKRPLHMRRADNRRRNKVARIARRKNRR